MNNKAARLDAVETSIMSQSLSTASELALFALRLQTSQLAFMNATRY
jgi:hypothetical protein